MSTISLSLPYPPTVNHYWVTRGKRRFLSKAAKSFRDRVVLEVRHSGLDTIQTGLSVSIDLHPPDKRVRDIDNVLKPILDALEAAEAYINDNQVFRLAIERKEIIHGGKAIARLSY